MMSADKKLSDNMYVDIGEIPGISGVPSDKKPETIEFLK